MPEFTVFKGSKEGKIVKSTTTRELKEDEVLVKITHSGLCGTDDHYKKIDMVLGHEGTGTIEEVGSAVRSVKIGDVVGWGYIHGSCGECKQCLTGHDTLCPRRALYGETDLDVGSFAQKAIIKAAFAFKIPDSISPEHACCLQCGGATVFNVLASFGAKPTHRVGIIGVGGLGHLAIQFAAKMGCQVVVFSQTDSKKEEALRLGANEFVATKGVKKLDGEPVDHLIVTTSFQPDWNQILPVLAPSGTIYPLSVSFDDLTVPYMPVLLGEYKIQGSLVAARQVHRDMLDFAARHEIKPIIEKFELNVDGIETAMKKLENGQMRYRGVLVAQ